MLSRFVLVRRSMVGVPVVLLVAVLLIALASPSRVGAKPAGAATRVTAQTAQAATAVPCSTSALVSDLLAAYDHPGATTVLSLAAGCTYAIPAPSATTNPGGAYYGTDGTPFDWYGPSGLPAIDGTVTIDGNGATLSADESGCSSAAQTCYRFFDIGADPAASATENYTSPGAGSLTLSDLVLTGGVARGGSSMNGGGGGAGMGGAVFNQGTLVLSGVTLDGDTATGGAAALDDPTGVATGGGGIGTDGTASGDADGGGFGPGTFGGATGGAAGPDGGNEHGGGGGGFATADTGQPGASGGAGGGVDTGLGGAGSAYSGGGGGGGFASVDGGDGSGGGGEGNSGIAGSFGVGGEYGDGGGVGGGGGGNEDAGGGFGGGGAYGSGVDGGAGGFGAGGGGDGSGTVGAPGYGAGTGSGEVGGGGAGMGGAVFNMEGTVSVTNSTLTGDTATGGTGGAATADGYGGAVFNLNGSVAISFSTLVDNTADNGGGAVYSIGYDARSTDDPSGPRQATVTVAGSILAQSVGTTVDLAIEAPSTTTAGANTATATGTAVTTPSLIGDAAAGGPGASFAAAGTTVSAASPRLGALADNDSSTLPTLAPESGSPTLGAGTACPVVDEVGDPRPQTGCDLGALELTPITTSGSVRCNPASVVTGTASSCTMTVEDTDGSATPTGTVNFAATPTGTFTDGSACALNGSGASASCAVSFSSAAPGSETITATVPAGPTQPATTATATVTDTAPSSGGGTSVAPVMVPVDTTAPSISGSTASGSVLRCAPGEWSGTLDAYAYQWSRDGTPIVGATDATYTVIAPDEGNTLTCTVTASDGAGTGSPTTSAGVPVVVPKVARCPAAIGSLRGTRLGPVQLGMSRAQAAKAFIKSSSRGLRYEEFFCLTPIGVRVGYGSPKELSTLPARERNRYAGRVIWISTASAYYAVDGVRVGATVAAAGARLHLGKQFVIGANDWYLAPAGSSTAVLKVRHGVVQEIGIAERTLTGTRTAQRRFLTSFQ